MREVLQLNDLHDLWIWQYLISFYNTSETLLHEKLVCEPTTNHAKETFSQKFEYCKWKIAFLKFKFCGKIYSRNYVLCISLQSKDTCWRIYKNFKFLRDFCFFLWHKMYVGNYYIICLILRIRMLQCINNVNLNVIKYIM